MSGFPWVKAAKIGFGLLHLSPKQFWQLTPRELVLIVNAFEDDTSQTLDRSAFEQMASKFPDKEKRNG